MVAKERLFSMSVINVVTQPHSPENYVALFKDLFKLRTSTIVRGDAAILLGELRPMDRDAPEKGVRGRFYRYTEIDKNAKWFNLDTAEEASEEDLEKVSIPDGLRPNLKESFFFFNPTGHKLFYISHDADVSLPPGHLIKHLNNLCSSPIIVKKYGDVDLTAIPDSMTLEKILTLPQINKLLLDIKKPNPDDLGDLDDEIFERMREMGVRRERREYTAEAGETIKIEGSTLDLAKVAARNGEVVVTGRSAANERVSESTKKFPLSQVVRYDTDLQSQSDALINAAQNFR